MKTILRTGASPWETAAGANERHIARIKILEAIKRANFCFPIIILLEPVNDASHNAESLAQLHEIRSSNHLVSELINTTNIILIILFWFKLLLRFNFPINSLI